MKNNILELVITNDNNNSVQFMYLQRNYKIIINIT